jgi:ADP-ribose pyrophosphatase YjhB (NUDIX family)
VLGLESKSLDDFWFVFKGGKRYDETPEQAAIREVYEETCGLVKLNSIKLEHQFSTKRKRYCIGLVEVPFEIINRFEYAMQTEAREEFMEKKSIKFFKYPEVLDDPRVHEITKCSISYYTNTLQALKSSKMQNGIRARFLGISVEQAEKIKDQFLKPPDINNNVRYTTTHGENSRECSPRRTSSIRRTSPKPDFHALRSRSLVSKSDINMQWRSECSGSENRLTIPVATSQEQSV